MKKLFILAAVTLFATGAFAADEIKIGYVNVKNCIEKSKHGNDEKVAFEALKKQMNDTLEKSDKELGELAKKLEDQDYLDTLSPQAEQELKAKFEGMSQEFVRYQNQYYQLLQQANYRMLHTLHEAISKASEEVRAKQKFTFILNQDSAFAASSNFDVTDEVIKAMNSAYEKGKGVATNDPKATPKA